MENLFKHLSDYEINLMVAKEELKGQPFVKFLPQRDIFGSNVDQKDASCMVEDSVFIITESGREQEINFCTLSGDWQSIMLKGRTNINFYDCPENHVGGFCSTDTSFFVDFENDMKLPRAVSICYLISKGILEPEA